MQVSSGPARLLAQEIAAQRLLPRRLLSVVQKITARRFARRLTRDFAQTLLKDFYLKGCYLKGCCKGFQSEGLLSESCYLKGCCSKGFYLKGCCPDFYLKGCCLRILSEGFYLKGCYLKDSNLKGCYLRFLSGGLLSKGFLSEGSLPSRMLISISLVFKPKIKIKEFFFRFLFHN